MMGFIPKGVESFFLMRVSKRFQAGPGPVTAEFSGQQLISFQRTGF